MFLAGFFGCFSLEGEVFGVEFVFGIIVAIGAQVLKVSFGGDSGGLTSLSMALERGRNGLFPKKVRFGDDFAEVLSWKAGGGEIMGVCGGGEEESAF